jgi:hypothetical protein
MVVDTAPDVNGKQHAVTALGGTQAGVSIHSVSSPFTATFIRPKAFKGLDQVNPVTGKLPFVPKNSWQLIIRKGAIPLVNQNPSTLVARCEIAVPAGADLASPAELRAAISLLVGIVSQQSAGIGDSLVSGL